MHDEAATHYVGMVDQTTLGHRLLKQEFGELGVPTVAWQLDPFGHSATQAALLSAEAGMDSLFFGRVDYQDLAERRARKAAEWVWRASPSLGADAQVFTGLTGSFGGSYCWPSGLNWAESGDGGNAEPVELNEELETYNKQSRVDDFVAAATSQGAITRGRHVMFTMGCDFNYLNAEPVFANMDKIIAAVNADGRVRARYSTPAEYVAEKRAETASGAVEWPLTNGTDLFPYRDVPNAVWSGYFTSRPALKGYMRSLSSYLNMAWQLLALAHGGSAPPKGEGEGGGEGEGEGESEGGGGGEGGGEGEGEGGSIDALEDALGIAQHHDAMTGTAKQHVAFDYARRLAAGVAKAEPLVATALDTLLSGCGCGGGSGGGGRGGGSGGGAWRSCARLNETVCAATQSGGGARLAVWNQLGRPRRELVVLPVSSAHVAVRDAKGASVPVQVFAAAESVTNYRRRTAEASWQAAFFAEVPAAGAALFSLAQGADAAAAAPAHEATVVKVEAGAAVEAAPGDEQFVTIENEHVALLFSRANGHLEAMIDKARGGATTTLNHTFCYYAASVGGQGSLDHDSGQSSGAYIFRPDDALCRPVAAEGGGTVQLEVVRGEVVSEVRQTFAPWLTQTVRLAAGERHASLEWTVGEVPLDPPPDAPASQRCVAWRGEPPLNCTQGIAPTAQGYCECAGGRRAGVVGAGGHPYFTCEEACRLHGGREIVSRFSTSLASADVLLTDSNGREMLARRRGHRPTYNLSTKEPVASNYFPVGTTAAIRDAAAATQLTLLVDRAQGGASLAPGQIELMVHRRLIKDDGRGAAEALNETEAVASYAAPQGEGQTTAGRGLAALGTRPRRARHTPPLARSAAHRRRHVAPTRRSSLCAAAPPLCARATDTGGRRHRRRFADRLRAMRLGPSRAAAAQCASADAAADGAWAAAAAPLAPVRHRRGPFTLSPRHCRPRHPLRAVGGDGRRGGQLDRQPEQERHPGAPSAGRTVDDGGRRPAAPVAAAPLQLFGQQHRGAWASRDQDVCFECHR